MFFIQNTNSCMKNILLILYLFLSVSYCKKEPDKVVSEKQYLYTDSLSGTSIYETPETTSSILESIPHATKVEIIPARESSPSLT